MLFEVAQLGSSRRMKSMSMVNEFKDPKMSPSKTTGSTARVKLNR